MKANELIASLLSIARQRPNLLLQSGCEDCGEPVILNAFDLTVRPRFQREALRGTGPWPWKCRTHLEAVISEILRVVLRRGPQE